MTVHLPPHIESSIRAAIHSGRYAALDDAMTEAATLLVERLEQDQAEAASQPEWPGLTARRRPSRSATSLSPGAPGAAARKRPRGRPALSFSSRACRV
jgi:Arc/MetJ-type ribon-helix-helix transcriptional regulator